MTPRLSIVCPALVCRVGQWPILGDVAEQCEGLPVEMLVLMDRGEMSIGEKMNRLYSMASGEYVAGIADDDRVAPDYVSALLEAIGESDVVTFNVAWESRKSIGTSNFKPLAAVRLDLARRFKFPDWYRTEDAAFQYWLHRRKPSARHLNKTLYYHQPRSRKQEFGGRMYHPSSGDGSGPFKAYVHDFEEQLA